MRLEGVKTDGDVGTNTWFPLGIVLLNLCFTNECRDRYKDFPSSGLIPKLFEGWCPEVGEFSSRGELPEVTIDDDSYTPEIMDFQEEMDFSLGWESLTGLSTSSISTMKQWVSI